MASLLYLEVTTKLEQLTPTSLTTTTLITTETTTPTTMPTTLETRPDNRPKLSVTKLTLLKRTLPHTRQPRLTTLVRRLNRSSMMKSTISTTIRTQTTRVLRIRMPEEAKQTEVVEVTNRVTARISNRDKTPLEVVIREVSNREKGGEGIATCYFVP